MDVDTRVTTKGITRASVQFGLNGAPRGPVWIYREFTMHAALVACVATAPVGNPLNAVHRGGVVGTYKASFHSDRKGSNQSGLRFSISNSADHAAIVEFGRRTVFADQYFSWSRGKHPGKPGWNTRTRGRDGTHHIEKTVRRVMNLLS